MIPKHIRLHPNEQKAKALGEFDIERFEDWKFDWVRELLKERADEFVEIGSRTKVNAGCLQESTRHESPEQYLGGGGHYAQI